MPLQLIIVFVEERHLIPKSCIGVRLCTGIPAARQHSKGIGSGNVQGKHASLCRQPLS